MIPHEWLMAEVDELATNKARLCSQCRRRARFWPTRPETVVRAAGRGRSDRCETCVLLSDLLAASLHNRRPSVAFRLRVRVNQAEAVLEQIRDIEQLPPAAEREQALQMLYLQLQMLAEEVWSGGVGLKVLPGGRDRALGLQEASPLH